ncbi:beta-phosphoglucomutase [Winogradskyella sp.]|uniref:beta-phosphoglucomutase n=1 Tax=Winogradskyella sp. TaxID=1883156 RepID=UPI00261FA7F1|nr:beta-phosphoglucomutase [Winogradskyella sp.]
MKTKGFIFDLDGVIVDTAKYHFLAWKKLANSLDISFSEAENEQLKGVSRVKSLEKILSWGNKTISEDTFNRLMAEKNEDYLGHISKMDEDEILPDVPRVLNLLKKEKQLISLGSASKNARTILERVSLNTCFDAIVDGNDVSKAKPDPEVFLIAAKQLGIAPKNCIVFEDSIAGVEAANVANMISVGIGSEDVLGHAQHIFKDFTEISDEFIKALIER